MICSICVATYKRPEMLDRLLSSLVAQELQHDVALEVIVVDNDSDGSARTVVASYLEQTHIQFKYFIEPQKNISLARNLAVANACGAYLLFIDDDETADSTWAATLIDAIIKYEAEGVFGPVYPTFDKDAPNWLTRGAHLFAGTIPAAATGVEADSHWSGNCIVKAYLLKSMTGPFNPSYGATGGEDTELFARLARNGARFVYCMEARVLEYWPPGRTRLSYLFKRRFKGGNSHTRRIIAASNRKILVRLFMLAKAVTCGFVSLGLVAVAMPSRMWSAFWVLRFASNAGRFLAAVGHNYRGYK